MMVKDLSSGWFYAKPYIESAMEQSWAETADDLHRDLVQGNAQLWIADGGAAVTRVWQGKQRFLHIVALGGENVGEWIEGLMDEWKQYAKDARCDVIVAVGRPGWKKYFPKLGLQVKKITGICEVRHA